jgi:hypothetical protein
VGVLVLGFHCGKDGVEPGLEALLEVSDQGRGADHSCRAGAVLHLIELLRAFAAPEDAGHNGHGRGEVRRRRSGSFELVHGPDGLVFERDEIDHLHVAGVELPASRGESTAGILVLFGECLEGGRREIALDAFADDTVVLGKGNCLILIARVAGSFGEEAAELGAPEPFEASMRSPDCSAWPNTCERLPRSFESSIFSRYTVHTDKHGLGAKGEGGCRRDGGMACGNATRIRFDNALARGRRRIVEVARVVDHAKDERDGFNGVNCQFAIGEWHRPVFEPRLKEARANVVLSAFVADSSRRPSIWASFPDHVKVFPSESTG